MNAMSPAPAADSAIAVPQEQPHEISVVEQVVVLGDLARLTSEQRVEYYRRVCDSIGLNPLTRPFDYLILNGKLTLYANKGASEQLRSKRGISIEKVEREAIEDLFVVTAYGRDRLGRVDSSIGAVPFENLKGETKANAMMKAETKAKRRLTLSMAGLGMLDESEIDSINGAQRVDVDPETGEILRTAPPVRLVGGGSGTAVERDPSRPATTPMPSVAAGIGAETSLGQVVFDGTIEVNDRQRTDAQMRDGPKGPKLGFRFIVAGGGSVGQVIASGPIALAIAEHIDGDGSRLNGVFATVAGSLFAVPWKKKNAETGQLEAMPPTKRLDLDRIWTPDWTVPADQPAPGESPTDALEEAAQGGVNPPPSTDEPKQTTVADAAHEASKASPAGLAAEALDKALDADRVARSFAAAESQRLFDAAGNTVNEILGGLTDAQRLELASELGVLADEEN